MKLTNDFSFYLKIVLSSWFYLIEYHFHKLELNKISSSSDEDEELMFAMLIA